MIGNRLAAGIVVLACWLGQAAPAGAFGYYLDGTTLHARCHTDPLREACVSYIIGMYDFFQYLKNFAAIGEHFCAPEGLSAAQVAAVAVAYLDAHPESRHHAAPDLLFRAFVEGFPCPRGP